MTEAEADRYPRRDADGRFATIVDLLGVVVAGLIVGVVIMLAFEVAVALLQLADFGHASGWLAGILPVWVFVGYGGAFYSWQNAEKRHPVADVEGAADVLAEYIAK